MHNILPADIEKLQDPKVTALQVLHPETIKKPEETKTVAKNTKTLKKDTKAK